MNFQKKLIDKILKFSLPKITRIIPTSKILDVIFQNKLNEKFIVDYFHKLYYNNSYQTWKNTNWLTNQLYKCPFDLWIYQEIIVSLKPDIIIECGTYKGGSALFLANICELINYGRIITIDIEEFEGRPKHQRITFLKGSSTSKEIENQVSEKINKDDKVIVILDSDHSKEHVLNELRIYSKMVTKDYYLIVEDSNVNGHPVLENYGPGPMEAIEDFLHENKNFIIDKTKEKLYMTSNPNGYLKRIN